MDFDVLTWKKVSRGCPIKNQVKLMLRVSRHHSLHRFKRKPTYSVEPPWDHQTRVDCNHSHESETKLEDPPQKERLCTIFTP